MPATVCYYTIGSKRLTIRVRRGWGPVPVGHCVGTMIGHESDVDTCKEVTGLTLSEDGSFYVVGFDEEQKKVKQKKVKQKKIAKQDKKRKEHLYPFANVEWIEREGDWE